MFSSLKVKNYRIYWFGMFVSLIGTWVQAVAQSWLVFQLTNSALLLGVVGFLGSLPIFIFSLFGGVLADRVNKRNILIFTQSAFMLSAFALAALTQAKRITLLQIMIIVVFNGIVMAFDAPTRQAMVVELVGKAHLTNAIALSSISFNTSRVIGPALAGIFVASIGLSGCFYLNGASFLAVIIALFLVRLNKAGKAEKVNSALKDLKEGLIYVKNSRLTQVKVAIVAVVSMFGLGYTILMPVFAKDVLRVGVRGLGLLMSSAGAGALIGALILARLSNLPKKGALLNLSFAVFSASLFVFSFSRVYLLSVAALAFVGGSAVIAISLINTSLQLDTPDKFRGRVMSLFMLTFAGMAPFGSLIAGSIAHSKGAPFVVMLSAVVCGLFFLAANIAYPGIRKI